MTYSEISKISGQYHYKLKPMLLRSGSAPTRKLFLVHDGTGRIEGYFKLCAEIHPDFNVYGIFLDPRINGTPKQLCLEDIARSYVRQIQDIQASGLYYVAGWSIGGSIAFEMANQLEEQGHQVAFCGLLDPPPPGFYPLEDAESFSSEHEREWIFPFIESNTYIRELSACSSLEQMWESLFAHAEEYIVNSDSLVAYVKERWPLPDHILFQTKLLELLFSLNVIRTLHSSRVLYTPSRRLKAAVHVFGASVNPIVQLKEWNKYSLSTQHHLISGNHYTMLQSEHVRSFANQLNAALL